ncbi:MAG TPA: GH116 family glycosyl hydrolase, partial [Bryobacterales bacterium]|nr:GH116 family glycosyl hydrolase [Bryobacterales bacterium]
GGSAEVTFLLAWHFPNLANYWNREEEYRGKPLRTRYAERFPDAGAVAEYGLKNLPRLEGLTRRFHDAFFASTLPAPVLDAASSQASILRTTTCLYLEGRAFHAFEGSNDQSGCCPMNCTHVWNYEQTVAHLFPELERFMRRTDFLHNLRPDGSMAFRTLIPLGDTLWKFKPAADGQMGCVLKVYREWQLSGDGEFLRALWPRVKQALEYAWVGWDADRDGVMEGEQHNTYDIEFYGPNTFTGALYLAALLAASKMATALGDAEAAGRYHAIYERGSANLDQTCWDGDFYIQKSDPAHPKYQYGPGCLSDQLLGQWFASVVGLGHVLPKEHVHRALDSIYRHNFQTDFRRFANPQRLHALGDDKGLLVCSWPKGGRPEIAFPYSDEVWTGSEYQAAAHMIYEGLVDEGLAVVKAARDRYDGVQRNPWNEVECGNHYARAMSSWSLVLALSGYRYSAPERSLRLAPQVNAGDFRCFYSTGTSWGVLSQKTTSSERTASIEVLYGRQEVADLILQAPSTGPVELSRVKNEPAVTASSRVENGELHVKLSPPVTIEAGDLLRIRIPA